MHLDGTVLVPAVGLLAARWLRKERMLWALAGVGLVSVAYLAPQHLSLTAAFVAGVFALRAWRQPTAPAPRPEPLMSQPGYRHGAVPPALPRALPTARFAAGHDFELRRLAVGILTALYLAVWSWGYEGGHGLDHQLGLDVGFGVIGALLAWRFQAWLVVVPMLSSLIHLGVQHGWLGIPRDDLGWGTSVVGLGFALLAGGVGASLLGETRISEVYRRLFQSSPLASESSEVTRPTAGTMT